MLHLILRHMMIGNDTAVGFRKEADLAVPTSDKANSCGMCCAWHPWGTFFATSFQCGQVVVWDARSHKVFLAPCHVDHVDLSN
jgi:hypothetical protein